MTNYLLSIDPSIKNTGFILGEKFKHSCDKEECLKIYYGKPIGLKSYDFKKYSTKYEVSKSDSIYNNNFNYGTWYFS